MLERLTIRPELAAFESMLRERVERLSAVEDERISRPRWMEHDQEGALVVVSEFVPGSRLSDLLDAAAEQGAAPGLDAAFGYLLDVLPALCGLHAGAGFAHGTIAPSRTVLTPAGQVVLLDGIYGGALSLLRYSPRALWTGFGVAVPSTAGPARLDIDCDIAQVVLSSLMLTLGRPLYEDEFPAAIPRIMADVLEIAQIRGSGEFARSLQAFFERALPLPTGRPYTAADDALCDLRDLASQLGVDGCRRALVDFIEQMDPSAPAGPQRDEELDELPELTIVGFDEPGEGEPSIEFQDDIDGTETEINLDRLDEVAEPPAAGPLAAVQSTASVGLPDASSIESGGTQEDSAGTHVSPAADAPAGASNGDAQPAVRSKRAKRARSARARKDKLRSAATPAPLITQKAPSSESTRGRDTDAAAGSDTKPKSPAAKPEPAAGTDTATKPGAPEKPEADGSGRQENWLVPPGRAAAFDPPTPPAPIDVPGAGPVRPFAPPAAVPPAPPAVVPRLVPTPAIVPVSPSGPFVPPPLAPPANLSPIPVVPPPPSIAPRVAVPAFGAPPVWSQAPGAPPPAAVHPVAPMPAAAPVAPLKLKEPPPKPRAARPPVEDLYTTPLPPPADRQPAAFPWKLAAGAFAAVIVLIVVGRLFLMDGASSASDREEAAASATLAPPAASRTPTAPAGRAGASAGSTAPAPAAATGTGRIEIETQPAGAQVLLDGKAVGESPLALDEVPAGRHSVTLTNASGTVRRVIRVEPGRTLKIDVPIFSGWVGIFAPFVVVVSEGNQVIGTTEESRLMLSPGRHVLTLTNQELGYRAVETVDIEPGEVRSITLDPRGTVNLNATPWAEVWVDGKKAGDTPLAGLQLPLGTQEVVFKHPEYGERKVTVTVKGNQPVALSVDMRK